MEVRGQGRVPVLFLSSGSQAAFPEGRRVACTLWSKEQNTNSYSGSSFQVS